MKTSSAKAKGRRLQKEIVDLLNPILTWWRGENCVVEPIPMGQAGMDIVVHPLVEPWFPFAIEAKNQEAFSIWNACEQAESNCPPGMIPLVVFRRNHTKARVVMDMDDFAAIYEALHQFANEKSERENLVTVQGLINNAKTDLQQSRS